MDLKRITLEKEDCSSVSVIVQMTSDEALNEGDGSRDRAEVEELRNGTFPLVQDT